MSTIFFSAVLTESNSTFCSVVIAFYVVVVWFVVRSEPHVSVVLKPSGFFTTHMCQTPPNQTASSLALSIQPFKHWLYYCNFLNCRFKTLTHAIAGWIWRLAGKINLVLPLIDLALLTFISDCRPMPGFDSAQPFPTGLIAFSECGIFWYSMHSLLECPKANYNYQSVSV